MQDSEIWLNIDTEAQTVKPDKSEAGIIRNRLCDEKRICHIDGNVIQSLISQGVTFTPSCMTGTTAADWKSQQLLCADIDNALKDHSKAPDPLTIPEAIETMKRNGIEPFIIYHSFSSSPDWPKFRIMAALPEPMTDPEQAREANRKFQGLFRYSDPATKDLARFYYGTNGADKIVVPCTNKNTPLAAVLALPDPLQEHQTAPAAAAPVFAPLDDPNLLSALWSINPAQIDYNEWLQIGMALNAKGLSADLWEEWSAQDTARYNPGECGKKWNSFRGSGVNAGTIIDLAKRFGWNAPAYSQGAAPADRAAQAEAEAEKKSAIVIRSLSEDWSAPPPLADELIYGILRKGHKLLLQGASKAGKTYLLIQLACAITTGGNWLGFQCCPGKVLYIDFEVDRPSLINRIHRVSDAMSRPAHPENFDLLSLRGTAVTIPDLYDSIPADKYSLIIIDPTYKLLTGSENDQEAVTAFFLQIDKLVSKTRSAVAICHHHSKGGQGAKRSIDRGSGSGVFGRYPDAVIDLSELIDPDGAETDDNAAEYFRMSFNLREFPPHPSMNLVKLFPLMVPDADGITDNMVTAGTSGKATAEAARNSRLEKVQSEFANILTARNEANGIDGIPVTDLMKDFRKSERWVKEKAQIAGYPCVKGLIYLHPENVPVIKTPQQKAVEAFNACQIGGTATINEMAAAASTTDRTMRTWVNMTGALKLDRGVVTDH